MTAAPSYYGYAVILYPGKKSKLAAALSFQCLAVKSFHIDKVFLTVRFCFRGVTVIFIWLEGLFHRSSLAILTAPAHI